MSKHLFGLIVTPYGVAANNRGENEGNITTLQKLLWKNEIHTTVSAEAIRWALRYFWQRKNGDDSVNRRWDDETAEHNWQDQSWAPWTSTDEAVQEQTTFIDDDVMGFMLAEAANTDGNDLLDSLKADRKKIDVLSKGKTDKRRGALEVTRAISLGPFAGDITFNAKSGTKTNTSLYGTEVHATRYQYGVALTPQSLRVPARVLDVVEAITGLGEVAGNQSRFLFDFAPDSIVFRWTEDFAPRMLYGFEMDSEANLSFPAILKKVADGDIDAKEMVIGGEVAASLDDEAKETLTGASINPGVKAAAQEIKRRISEDLGVTGG